ncbi:MAG: NAD(P)-binding protein [Anaerolineae bacterium]|nr:NAD(P)-binding protein [Anaerolineae bacterium]MCX8068805.1 NAD(P)-binding protein [Anaerolineae bacterium]MDW7990747.1 NAD(P)-binding protein [Anaerolineae bacterium]
MTFVIGGGPAGLSAAIELGKAGVRTLIVDDKHRLGDNWSSRPTSSSVQWTPGSSS